MGFPDRRSSWFLTALVAAAVGIAFADSSIVVLALPQLYGHFRTSIEGVSWVVTAYNAAVAVAAFGLIAFIRRIPAKGILGAGAADLLGGVDRCSLAGSLAFLIAARCVQGVGAALLLTGALPVLGALTGLGGAGRGDLDAGGHFGIALGPALGGVLTQVFDWRAIFAAQAPVADPRFDRRARCAAWRRARRRLALFPHPNVAGKRLPRAALRCAGRLLFLSVLLVITVWGYSPIAGAGIVSVLPAATLAARPLGRGLGGNHCHLRRRGARRRRPRGARPAPVAERSAGSRSARLLRRRRWPRGPDTVGRRARPRAGRLPRSGTFTVGIRHLGLVPGARLDRAATRSRASRCRPPGEAEGHFGVAGRSDRALDQAAGRTRPGGRVRACPGRGGSRPRQAVHDRGAGTDPQIAATRDTLVRTIEETITRAFRPAFLLSAALAALALAVGVLRSAAGSDNDATTQERRCPPARAPGGAGALVGVEHRQGATGSVSPSIANRAGRWAPFTGGGIDGVIQRIVLDGLDGAACRLETSREELVLSLRSGTGVRLSQADRSTAEAAIRAGLLRSVDEANRRGDIPGFSCGRPAADRDGSHQHVDPGRNV